MDLTPEQKQKISQWAAEGLNLSNIQKKISEEFGISMTYMDARLLVIELGLALKDQQQPASREQVPPAGTNEAPQIQETDGAAPAAAPGSVSVNLDRVIRPGSVLSGSVTFSDGVTARWFVDQMGRLALEAAQPGYRPNQQDLQSFQLELEKKVSGRGV